MSFEEIRNKIEPLLKKHGAEYVAVFGSVARGETGPDSDVDILIRFNRDISLLKHIGIALNTKTFTPEMTVRKPSISIMISDKVKKLLKTSVLKVW